MDWRTCILGMLTDSCHHVTCQIVTHLVSGCCTIGNAHAWARITDAQMEMLNMYVPVLGNSTSCCMKRLCGMTQVLRAAMQPSQRWILHGH